MYWIEFAKAWDARRRCGGAPAEREVWRKQLHLRIGAIDRKGQPLSSTKFSNFTLDRFLAVCRGYSDSSNLNAQLELENQPVKRALVACAPLLDELQIAEASREAYVAGVYRNIQRGREARKEPVFELDAMPDLDLGLVLAALTHTVEHKLGIDHRHPSNRNRSSWNHRVGQRRAPDAQADLDDGVAHADVREPDPAYHETPDHPF